MKKSNKPQTKSWPRRLLDRTAEQWEEVILNHIDPEHRIKVACTVWWDFITRPQFEETPFFRQLLDAYVMERDELERDVLMACLELIGYPHNIITHKCSATWWDVKDEQLKSEGKKRQKIGAIHGR